MFQTATKLTIASVGMIDEQVVFFKKFLKDYGKNLDGKWQYEGNFDATETIGSMGSAISAEFLVVDIDDEEGKRVLYVLSAIRDESKNIAFTKQPWQTDSRWVIQKPLFDFKVDKGVFDFSKTEIPKEAEKLITLLNSISKG